MRYNFEIERLGKHLLIRAGQSLKTYLDFSGQIVRSVILFLLRLGILNFTFLLNELFEVWAQSEAFNYYFINPGTFLLA